MTNKIRLTLRNFNKCPKCFSTNVEQVTDHGRCLCNCDCWSHPECLDCGYCGYLKEFHQDKTEFCDMDVFNE
jgi:hypothetical protein